MSNSFMSALSPITLDVLADPDRYGVEILGCLHGDGLTLHIVMTLPPAQSGRGVRFQQLDEQQVVAIYDQSEIDLIWTVLEGAFRAADIEEEPHGPFLAGLFEHTVVSLRNWQSGL